MAFNAKEYLEIDEQSSVDTPAAGKGRVYFKSDGNAYIKNDDGAEVMIGVGTGLTIAVEQVAHGFSVGNVLRIDSGGVYKLARADTFEDSQVVGIVSEVRDADNFIVITTGRVLGLSDLDPGTLYYLSAAASGAMTESLTAKPIMVADTDTSGIFINTRNYGTIVLDRLTADPVDPAVGQMWLRVDV